MQSDTYPCMQDVQRHLGAMRGWGRWLPGTKIRRARNLRFVLREAEQCLGSFIVKAEQDAK